MRKFICKKCDSPKFCILIVKISEHIKTPTKCPFNPIIKAEWKEIERRENE